MDTPMSKKRKSATLDDFFGTGKKEGQQARSVCSKGESSDEVPSRATSRENVAKEPALGQEEMRSEHFDIANAQLEGEYTLTPSGNGRLRRSGSYTFDRSTSELSAMAEGGEAEPIGTFVYRTVAGSPLASVGGSESIPCISICDSEIMNEIQKGENAGAVFVLPSQLNGAEYPSNEFVVEHVNDYQWDNTGGPRGQLACHPAAAQFILNNAANERREGGIDAVREVLLALHKAKLTGFKLQNGYLVVPPIPVASRAKAVSTFQKNLHKMGVLALSGVPASGLTPDKRSLSRAKHNVSLVYASAVPVQTYTNATGEKERAFQETIAELVLTGQYLGALKLAAERSEAKARTKVFLMPLGGGVFRNPWTIIGRGMAKAVELLSAGEREKLDISVLTWQGNPQEKATLSKHLKEFGKLKS